MKRYNEPELFRLGIRRTPVSSSNFRLDHWQDTVKYLFVYILSLSLCVPKLTEADALEMSKLYFLDFTLELRIISFGVFHFIHTVHQRSPFLNTLFIINVTYIYVIIIDTAMPFRMFSLDVSKVS